MNEPMNHEQAYSRPVLLRQAREAAGLHIAALAAALKVPVKKLEALEAGRYEELPDLTFARALASSACRQLKVDPAPVLEQIPVGHQPPLGDTSSTINAPFKGAQGGQSLPAAEWLRRPAVLVSLALLVGAAALLLLPDWDTGVNAVRETVTDLSRAATPPQASAAPPAAVQETVTPVAIAAVAAPSQPVTPEPLPATAPVAPTPSPGVGEVAANATVAPSGTLLHIKATADSWVEVVDGAGKSQVQRMLKSGDVLAFSAAPPYSVVVGRADAVEVAVRGQAFDVMPYARNSVARFQVK
jgi:cytoskeleton protein RodZ